MKIPLPTPGCPWSELSNWALPNIKWCEAQSCGWVVEPVNTWSNLAYFALAWLIWRKLKTTGHPILKHFVWTSAFVGISSLIYHASYSFFFQFFDFVSMFTLISIMLALNLLRAGVLSNRQMLPFFLASLALNSFFVVFFYRIGIPIQIIIVVLILTILATEWLARARCEQSAQYRNLGKSLTALVGAGFFSFVDASRMICLPGSLFQGHAVWHLLTAVSIYYIFCFYTQFEFKESRLSRSALA